MVREPFCLHFVATDYHFDVVVIQELVGLFSAENVGTGTSFVFFPDDGIGVDWVAPEQIAHEAGLVDFLEPVELFELF